MLSRFAPGETVRTPSLGPALSGLQDSSYVHVLWIPAIHCRNDVPV